LVVRDVLALVRADGRQRDTKCPAHDDHRASLSIGRGDKKLVLDCKAGCAYDAILSAAGLASADLYFDACAVTSRIVAVYPYHDEGGLHLFDVCRFEPKDFRQRRADGVWSMKNVRRVLYRLPELQGKSVVYIVEGEKDVDRLLAANLTATTAPGGAGKWRPEYAQQLVGAAIEHVVILPDHDAPGAAHAADVAASCYAAGIKVKVVTLPGLPAKGDVCDWFDAGHTRDDLIALVRSTELYAPVSAPAAPVPNHAAAPVLIRLSDVTSEPIDWIWPKRLAVGKKTLLAGDPGEGKSTLTIDTAARITRGAAWPDGGLAPQGPVLFLCAEDGIADTVRPRIDAHGGDPRSVYVLEGVRDGSVVRLLNLARDLASLEQAIAQVQPRLVVIDPITAYLGKTDSYKDSEVRGLLAPVLAVIAKHRAALLTVAHLSKDQQRAALHRPGGSIAFVAAARLVFAVGTDPNDESRRVLAALKANICAKAPSLAFRLPDGHIEWDTATVVTLDAETLLRPQPGHDREDRTDAEHVIRDLLSDTSAWPLDAKAALEAGAAHGVSDRTMQRTAKRIGIRISRLGFGAKGRFVWHRPIDDIDDSIGAVSPSVSSMAPMHKPSVIDAIHAIDDKLSCTEERDADVLERL
jgi:hypothetical protein